MLSKTYSFGISGLDVFVVTIEVDVSNGMPSTTIVGLPDDAIRESKERIRSALKNSGFTFPARRITINLSPADIRKEGPAFDLAMALGILASTGQVDIPDIGQYAFLGELSLDGNIQPVRGSLPIAIALKRNQTEALDFKGLLLPRANAEEAALSHYDRVFPVSHLKDAIDFLYNPASIKAVKIDTEMLFKMPVTDTDFSDVKGQSFAKRGLEIAAAGGHNVLMIGPPGSGKSMLAKRLPTILPEMTLEESLETTQIHSIAGQTLKTGIIRQRPFRSPHHTTSDVAIVGGGSIPRPGEVSLSHHGILFLDELPEFQRDVLESLRQPLEDHFVTVTRAARSTKFPSKFMLVCTMNPCPCGFLTEPKKECHCSTQQVERYKSRISGPLLDRIDIHLEVPSLPSEDLLSKVRKGEPSKDIRSRVMAARKIQNNRFVLFPTKANSQMSHKDVEIHCPLNQLCHDLMKQAIDQLGLSARSYDKVLKISRTIADLEGQADLKPGHILEAIQYRSLDRNWKS